MCHFWVNFNRLLFLLIMGFNFLLLWEPAKLLVDPRCCEFYLVGFSPVVGSWANSLCLNLGVSRFQDLSCVNLGKWINLSLPVVTLKVNRMIIPTWQGGLLWGWNELKLVKHLHIALHTAGDSEMLAIRAHEECKPVWPDWLGQRGGQTGGEPWEMRWVKWRGAVTRAVDWANGFSGGRMDL